MNTLKSYYVVTRIRKRKNQNLKQGHGFRELMSIIISLLWSFVKHKAYKHLYGLIC